MPHPRPPCRDRPGCAPGAAAGGLAHGKKGLCWLCWAFPARGKVRGEAAAPGTAGVLPRGGRGGWVCPPCLWCCYPGVAALSCMGQETCRLPLSLLGCPGTAADIATVGMVTVPLWGHKVPPPGQAEQPWSPRSVVIPGGSCSSNLQPLPMGGLALEGAFQNSGKAESSWSCLGGVSPLSGVS